MRIRGIAHGCFGFGFAVLAGCSGDPSASPSLTAEPSTTPRGPIHDEASETPAGGEGNTDSVKAALTSPAQDMGINKKLRFSTDESTNVVTGLLQLQSMNREAKATLAYLDETGQEVIWLQAHDYLKYPENRHRHFSIEASDDRGLKQTRLGVGYGADVVDVTVNQAELVINRNKGRMNGNIVMTGSGGGGALLHANAFNFYPKAFENQVRGLRLALAKNKVVTLSANGSDELHVDDDLVVERRISTDGTRPTAGLTLGPGHAFSTGAPLKMTPGSLTTIPEEGAIEFDGQHLYVTSAGIRRVIMTQSTGQRVAVADSNHSASSADTMIAFTSLTSDRTVTLPPPSSMADKELTIKDESGAAGKHAIRVSGAVDGANDTSIKKAYGSLQLYSNGSAWFTR